MNRLEGKVAIVTGSGKGIGLRIAHELADLGATMVVSDLDDVASEKAAAEVRGATSIPCDVRDEAQVQALVARTVEAHGHLDIMVPNAGVGVVAPLLGTDLEAWRRVTSVNLDGVFLSIRYAAPAIIEAGGGSIVTVASITATAGSPLIGSYAAAKAGVLNLTKTAAVELRDHGVRANAVLPGFIDTDLVSDVIGDFESQLGMQPGDFSATVMAKQGRWGTPDDVARAVAFLADPEQSWVTGAGVTLDGGMSANLL